MKDLTTEDTESTEVNDGGPAFPVVHAIVSQPGHFVTAPPAIYGMSLRDWFAGQAMAALIQKDTECEKFELLANGWNEPASYYDDNGNLVCAVPLVTSSDGDGVYIGLARECYSAAEAMIEAKREREGKSK